MNENNPLTEINKAKTKSRILLSVFFITLIVVSIGLTEYWRVKLENTREAGVHKFVHFECIEVLSGDRILVQQDNITNQVQLIGISSPNGAFKDLIPDLTDQQLNKFKKTSRDALLTWLLKRPIELVDRNGVTIVPAPDQVIHAHAALYGVDVGRKQLQGGQAIMNDEQHSKLDLYKRSQREAQDANRWLWKYIDTQLTTPPGTNHAANI